MKRLAALFLLLMLPCTILHASEFGDIRISYLKGDVQIYSEEADDWVLATVNTPLGEEDRLWVPEGGRAEVQIRGGVYIRLDERSALDLITLEDNDWQFYLGSGQVYINNRQGGIDHIQIDTPSTSVSSYDNSILMLNTNGGEQLELSVLKGYSTVETERGSTNVEAGHSLRIHDTLSAETAPLPEPDSWEKWNHQRDQKQLAASESLRYIPDELDDSAPELDQYGSWHFNAEFGYVWRPRLSLTASWAPYRDGRWIWRYGTYTWISYEPWGWGPYHYGRWAFVRGFGWCWVPPRPHEVIWAPGYVAWVEYRDHVAWVPLAPGEAYYGHFPRRRGAPAPPPRTEVRQVYRNITINNSVTIVNRQTFLTGRKQKVTLRENPFLTRGGSTSAPAIRPVRESTSPVISTIAPNRKPPERILRIKPDQIRQERKLRRSQSDRVLRQNAPAAEMPVTRRPEPRSIPRPEQLQKSREQIERTRRPSRPAPAVTPPAAPAVSQPQSRVEGTRPPATAAERLPQSRTRNALPRQREQAGSIRQQSQPAPAVTPPAAPAPTVPLPQRRVEGARPEATAAEGVPQTRTRNPLPRQREQAGSIRQQSRPAPAGTPPAPPAPTVPGPQKRVEETRPAAAAAERLPQTRTRSALPRQREQAENSRQQSRPAPAVTSPAAPVPTVSVPQSRTEGRRLDPTVKEATPPAAVQKPLPPPTESVREKRKKAAIKERKEQLEKDLEQRLPSAPPMRTAP